MQKERAAALKAAVRLKETKKDKLQQWRETSVQQQFANEFTVAARLGEPAFTEEQAQMVASLFGR